MEYQSANQSIPTELDLLDYLGILWQRRKTVIFWSSLFLAGGIIFSLVVPTRWQSTATMYPITQTQSYSGMASIAAAAGIDIPQQLLGENNINLYPEILKSRVIIEQILQLQLVYRHHNEPITATVREYLRKANLDRSIQKVRKICDISIDRRSNVITLGVETHHPEVSQQIAQTFLRLLEEFNQETHNQQSMDILTFIEDRLDEKESELDSVEECRREWREAHADWYQTNDPGMLKQMSELERDVMIHQATYTTLAQQYEIARIEANKDMPSTRILDHPSIPEIRSFPRRKILTLATLLMGMLLGTVIAIGQHLWEQRYVSDAQ